MPDKILQTRQTNFFIATDTAKLPTTYLTDYTAVHYFGAFLCREHSLTGRNT